jgi:hypothetical protein
VTAGAASSRNVDIDRWPEIYFTHEGGIDFDLNGKDHRVARKSKFSSRHQSLDELE